MTFDLNSIGGMSRPRHWAKCCNNVYTCTEMTSHAFLMQKKCHVINAKQLLPNFPQTCEILCTHAVCHLHWASAVYPMTKPPTLQISACALSAVALKARSLNSSCISREWVKVESLHGIIVVWDFSMDYLDKTWENIVVLNSVDHSNLE